MRQETLLVEPGTTVSAILNGRRQEVLLQGTFLGTTDNGILLGDVTTPLGNERHLAEFQYDAAATLVIPWTSILVLALPPLRAQSFSPE